MIGLKYLTHCVGGCYRGAYHDTPLKQCSYCGSGMVAVWKEGRCLISYTGKVDYPFGSRMPFGTDVLESR